MELHFPKLGHAVDVDDRWAVVDVEPVLEAATSERKERRTFNIDFSMEWLGGQEMKETMYLLPPNVVIRSKDNLETIST